MTEVQELRSLRRRTGQVLATAFGSQVVAAAAIASTSLLGLAVSDSYAIGLQVGNGAFTGVALGIVYFLAIGRPGFDGWGRWKAAAAGCSIALTAVTLAAIVLRHDADHLATTVAVTCVLGVGGAFLGVAGVDAVREACLGRPVRMASLTILPNCSLVIGTLAALTIEGPIRVAMPAVAWALGCVGVMLSGARSASREPARETTSTEPHRMHALGLAVGAVVSTFMPPLFLTAVAHLEPGTATVLLLVTRVGGSAVGLVANSLLATRYSWSRTDVFKPAPFEGLIGASLACFVAVVVLDVTGAGGAVVVVGLAWWLLALVPTPFVNREVNARRRAGSVLLKGLVDLACALVSLTLLLAAPSALGYLAVFVVSQGLSVVIGATTLGYLRLAVLSALLLASGWAGLLLGAA